MHPELSRTFGRQHSFHRRLVYLTILGITSLFLTSSLIGSAQASNVKPAVVGNTGTASAGNTGTTSPSVPYTTSLVLIGPNQLIGGLYQPVSPDPNQSIALLLTHGDANFIGTTPCLQLAQRGFTVLCVKTQYDAEGPVIWDNLALDVSVSVSYLRSLPTVKKVLLVGYSGGGAIVSYYQNVAENGIATCQAPARLDPCSSSLANMSPADGVVMLDSVAGAYNRFIDLDASIVNEKNLNLRDSALDMFNPANGYNPNGSSNYSRAFIDRYTVAQGQREARIVAMAERDLKEIANGTAQYSDDVPFPTGRDNAEISEADLNVIAHTQGEYPVISPQYPNGSPPQVVNSNRPVTNNEASDLSWTAKPGDFTAESYMSTSAIIAPDLHITADSITGVDWASTNTSPIVNVAGIKTPILFMGLTASMDTDPVTQEMFYQAAVNTTNKTLVYVYGATHGLTPCTNCGTPSSQT